jgi:hypothetical protein
MASEDYTIAFLNQEMHQKKIRTGGAITHQESKFKKSTKKAKHIGSINQIPRCQKKINDKKVI